MKAETFMNAVGLIGDRHLDVEIPKKRIIFYKFRKVAVAVAAAALLIVFPLPALTAFGVDSAYNILYHISHITLQ